MKYERILKPKQGSDPPVVLKIGLFRADRAGKWGFSLKFRPLGLFYVFIPGVLKVWVSVEKNVFSVAYCVFMKYNSNMEVGQ